MGDDPVWQYLYPPNGWRCRCRVRALSDADVADRDLTVESSTGQITFVDQPIGNTGQTTVVASYTGVGSDGKRFTLTPDTGWDYNPGQAWQGPFTPRPMSNNFADSLKTVGTTNHQKIPISDLPTKPLSPDMLLPSHQASGWSETDYVAKFLAEFGAAPGKPVVFRDKIDDAVVISEEFFRDRVENKLKVFRADREVYLKLLADTIKDPAEIWLIEVKGVARPRLCKRYIGLYQDEKQKLGGFVVFDLIDGQWQGTTAFRPRNLTNLDKQREGVLLYTK